MAQIEEAKVKLKKAIEEGNVDVQAEAQSAMAKAALNAERAKIQRESLEAQAKTFAETKETTSTIYTIANPCHLPRHQTPRLRRGQRKTSGLDKTRL